MVIKKEGVGERGKTAQDLTKKHLDLLNTKTIRFAFERVKDARSAGGSATKAICDFMCWYLMDSGVAVSIPLEVKSTEHGYRLAKDKLSQLAILKKIEKAGAKPYVLVLFKGLEQWRIAPISYFSFGVPSWDMSNLPLFPTAQAALESTDLFPRLP